MRVAGAQVRPLSTDREKSITERSNCHSIQPM
jgi:hypothetical protein